MSHEPIPTDTRIAEALENLSDNSNSTIADDALETIANNTTRIAIALENLVNIMTKIYEK